MKVLMFGWEFPPYISGGLGTACAGLTRALEKEDVEILFVVPKLHGGEQGMRTHFISASHIEIPQVRTIEEIGSSKKSGDVEALNSRVPLNSPFCEKTEPEILETPSLLNPYAPTTVEENVEGIRLWNYAFDNSAEPHGKKRNPFGQPPLRSATTRMEYFTARYQFSGTYGGKLMEEVERYAEVGAEIARTHSFDIIHAHDWMTYKAGIAASQASGKPLVVHVHATEIDRSGNINSRVFEIEKQGMQFAGKVVTVSAWTKAIAVKHYGVDEAKIEVVHNGITPKTDFPIARIATPLGTRMVTYLGRITHQKGPMYFIEAARKVHEKFPDIQFVVAGSGDLLPDMIARIAQLRLSRYFHFTGFLNAEDIERVWAMSAVYVMPSVSEPFGIAPLEAIQAGVPVILSKQAGVGEVMSHAIKVDFWNSDALAEAICSVLRFKSLSNTLKANGAEEVKEITWDKAAKKLTKLYYDLISKQEMAEERSVLFSGTPTQTAPQAQIF